MTFDTLNTNAGLIALARTIAERYSLDAALVCAIAEQESSWEAHALRYEPAFRMRYVAPLGLPPTEEIARSISWGLMQVMGQVAREHGFTGKFLSALCEPSCGIEIGCAVFAAKIAEAARALAASRDTDGIGLREPVLANEIATRALELWNGGGNPDYAAQVLARVAHYK